MALSLRRRGIGLIGWAASLGPADFVRFAAGDDGVDIGMHDLASSRLRR